MRLDDTRFPLVYLRAHEDGEGHDAAEDRNSLFEGLLGRAQPFVLIAENPDHDHDEETSEERKARAKVFKQMKGRMRKYCLGLILVEDDGPAGVSVRLAATAVQKMLGLTVQFVPDEATATAKALALLHKHAVPVPGL